MPIHKDKLGKPIGVSDCVVVPHNNQLIIARVVKINPKMVKIKDLVPNKCNWYTGEFHKYPEDILVINWPEVTAYLLKL